MQTKRYYRALGVAFSILLAITGAAQAASLQFIIYCDTIDPSIGTAHDLELCSMWAQNIANQTGLELHLQSLSGTDLTPTGARDLLNALQPAEDDVVFFIFSGHGANPGNSLWPMFTLLTDLNDPVTFDEVVAILQPKTQRALFVMADCCNVVPTAPSRIPPLLSAGDPALVTANYQRLFAEFRGTILVSASTAGQYSLSDPVFNGGLFLYTLVNDVNALAANVPDLTWEQVLATTAADAKNRAETWIGEEDIDPQEAFYTIDAEQVESETPTQPDSSDTNDNTDTAAEDNSSATSPCGAMGMFSLAATALGCFVLKGQRRFTRA